MSIKTVRTSGDASKTLDANTKYFATPWVRNPTWLPMPATTSSDERVDILTAIFPESNYVALFFATSSGTYNVDWGDGTSSVVASAVQAEKLYSFSSGALANTDGPVTFNHFANTVNRTAHGYTNDMPISFATVVTTTGVVPNRQYYVINATTNDFQVSATKGGSVVSLVFSGTGTILPYKQAMIVVTPTTGGASLTNVQFSVKHSATNLQAYAQPFLDATVSANTTFNMNLSATTAPCRLLERCRILRFVQTVWSNMFSNASSLRVVEANTSTVVNFDNVFLNCVSLTETPNFDYSSATSMSATFSGCNSIQYAGPINAPSCTNIPSLFLGCSGLRRIASLNFGAVTDATSMFSGCASLQYVPFFNTGSVTNFTSMFSGCGAIIEVPLYNTASGTNFSSMFLNARSLISVPRFNLTSATTFTSMYQNCASLVNVPPMNNTSSVTNAASMFSGCSSLVNAPAMNLSGCTTLTSLFASCSSLLNLQTYDFNNATSMASVFSSCNSLVTVPPINATSATSFVSLFQGCSSLTYIDTITTSGALTSLATTFSSCSSLVNAPWITTTSAVTAMSSMFTNCTSLQSIPKYAASPISFLTAFSGCSSLTSVPAISASSATASSGYTSMFLNCPSLSKIEMTGHKFTFTVANCKLSGAALDALYTNLASVSGQTITVSGNVGTATDTPSIATSKGWTVTGS